MRVAGIFIFTNIICKWSGFNDFSFSKFDISDMEIISIGMGFFEIKNLLIN